MPLTVTPGTAAFAADGTIGIGGEEPTGPVSIDFTFDYGGTTTVVTVVAQIQTTTDLRLLPGPATLRRSRQEDRSRQTGRRGRSAMLRP